MHVKTNGVVAAPSGDERQHLASAECAEIKFACMLLITFRGASSSRTKDSLTQSRSWSECIDL